MAWPFSDSVTMIPRANVLCKSELYSSQNISKKKKTSSICDSKNVAHAFVTSHKVGFCNALLSELPKYLHQQLRKANLSVH